MLSPSQPSLSLLSQSLSPSRFSLLLSPFSPSPSSPPVVCAWVFEAKRGQRESSSVRGLVREGCAGSGECLSVCVGVRAICAMNEASGECVVCACSAQGEPTDREGLREDRGFATEQAKWCKGTWCVVVVRMPRSSGVRSRGWCVVAIGLAGARASIVRSVVARVCEGFVSWPEVGRRSSVAGEIKWYKNLICIVYIILVLICIILFHINLSCK